MMIMMIMVIKANIGADTAHTFSVVPQLRRLVFGFPPRQLKFDPSLDQMVFVLDKVALGRVFSQYFGFLCHFSLRQLLDSH
jgi:hypothetical protein